MRVFRRFATRVVLPVNGDPLARQHAGAHPQPETENVAKGRVKIEASVRCVPVQVQRHAHERELHHEERDEHITPETEIDETVQKIERHLSSYLRSV